MELSAEIKAKAAQADLGINKIKKQHRSLMLTSFFNLILKQRELSDF